MLAEDALVCDQCGNLRSVCSDKSVEWIPQREVCYATADRELTMRRLQAKFKNREPGTRTLHPFDGVSIWMSQDDWRPDEKFFDLAHEQSPPDRDGNDHDDQQ